ncbi:hypothetical protein ABZ652_01115 [Micromonospora chalcea]|uniref:hypothetical protein n=1 Tax=Micromonospora chalcea TaxID=1874 RepID=UPI00340AB6EE
MTRARTAAALSAALLLALAGCSDDAEPSAAPTSSAPVPLSPAPATSAAVDDRATCRANADAAGKVNLDPTDNLVNGQLALGSSQPGIAAAGKELTAAATADPVVNVDIAQAQVTLAEACAAVFGDGPW